MDEHVDAFQQDPAPGCSFVRDGPVIGATVLAHTGELDRARTLAAVVGDPMADLATASAWQARFAIASGDPEAARRISADKARERRLYGPQHVHALLEALAALEDWPGSPSSSPGTGRRGRERAARARLRPGRGAAHAQAGRTREAAQALRRALAGFERLGVPFEAARTRERLAAVEPPGAARSLLEAALATYERLACAPAGGGPCGPGSARRPDRRGRGPPPRGPRSCG